MAGSISATTATIIAASVTAATAVGTTLYAAENQPSAPKAPTPGQSATEQAQAQQDAAQAQAHSLQLRRGMASTMLTSPLGTSGTAQIQKATLG